MVATSRRASYRFPRAFHVATMLFSIAGCQPVSTESPAEPLRTATPVPASTATSSGSTSSAVKNLEPGTQLPGMVWVPGGTFTMGTDNGPPDEQPAHQVTIDGFWMMEAEVTNQQFLEFVTATGYQTSAERAPKRSDFIGQVEDPTAIPEENLVAGSICFNSSFDPKSLKKDHPLWVYQVWKYVKDANWRHPEGPESNIHDRLNQPVIHVNWDDAMAFCSWAGLRLPTEAEYEFASAGGQPHREFPWGNELTPDGKWLCNIWQGEFPYENSVADKFKGLAPVKSFPPNELGLYDIVGNAWEWCYDWYQPDYYGRSPKLNPVGPTSGFDPLEPTVPKRVQRGGSFMCSDNYCKGYRIATRMKGDPTSSSFHLGFRGVLPISQSANYVKSRLKGAE